MSKSYAAAWRHPRHAVAFGADIADRAIARNRKALRDEIEVVVQKRLQIARDERLHEYPESDAQYRLFRERYRDEDPARAVFALVDLVGGLWYSPEHKLRHVYRRGVQAGIEHDEIMKFELEHRFDDLDPEGVLDRVHRLAFEAAWLAGQYRFAKQLVQDVLR